MYFGKRIKTEKEASGFSNNIIYIVKGDSFPVKDRLAELGARYRRDFGWYFGSFCNKPESIPEGLELIEIKWEEVGNDDETFKNEEVIKEVVESKLFELDPSEWQGNIGERIEVFVVVASRREFEGAYGTQYCYNFRDELENCYSWFTSASTKTKFEEGETVTIRGSVKAHDKFRNIKMTQLSRVSKRG